MEKDIKILGKLTIDELSLLIRDFYLARGFTDNKYLENFERWFFQKIDSPVESLENAFLKTVFVSSTVLEIRYQRFKIILILSLFFNLVFSIYFFAFKLGIFV